MDTPGNLQEPEDIVCVVCSKVEYFSFELSGKTSPHHTTSVGMSISYYLCFRLLKIHYIR